MFPSPLNSRLPASHKTGLNNALSMIEGHHRFLKRSTGDTQVFAAFVFGLGNRWAPDFFDVFELARLMANLGDERGYALRPDDLVIPHRSVEYRHKNAGNWAGAGKDL